MNWLKAIGSFLIGGTSGSGSNGMEIVKGVGNWIDNQQFTEQEKAVDSMKRAELYGQFFKQTMEENSERSRTRRQLSLLVIRWWLLTLTFSALLYPVNLQWSEYVFKIATYTGVTTLVLGIGAFFWGTHLIRGMNNKQG